MSLINSSRLLLLLPFCTAGLTDVVGQGYFEFRHGDGPIRIGSITGPLAETNIVSQILAGVDGLTLTPVGVPNPNHFGVIITRNIVEVPFLNPQDTVFVRYAAWDATIWGMDYRRVPSEDVGISSLSTVFLYQKDRDTYLTPVFQGTVIVPQSVPEPETVVLFGVWATFVVVRSFCRLGRRTVLGL